MVSSRRGGEVASSSSSTSSSLTMLLYNGIALVTGAVASAVVTYHVTKRKYDREQRERIQREHQREKMLREKVAIARSEKHEQPHGTLLEEVAVDKVYLWECEDLRKKFAPAMVENIMKCKSSHEASEGGVRGGGSNLRSPALRMPASKAYTAARCASDIEDEESHETPYNRLITDHECILGDIIRKPNMHTHSVSYMRAGPRRYLHFDPAKVNAAIVTCGGLCPGLNNVVREITKTLHQIYGIGGTVYGIQGGFRGFYDTECHLRPIVLTPDLVENIHHTGGTVLGSSRGGFDLEKILDFIREKNISQLYVIGGDGTHRGAYAIHEGCMQNALNVSCAGIPKTIDNDVEYIDRSFGFDSAVEEAQVAIRSAKTEAICNLPNGIGIVKLMGRSAGYIAAHATMASSDIDLCLVPEVPIVLEGPKGCLPHLRRRVKQQGYAVVVVAEGAGEELLGTAAETDASGNKKLPPIGEYMKRAIVDYFAKHDEVATVKYIDPSYTVRSVPANAADSLYCMQLAQNAVHGAMAGYTGFSVGLCKNRMVFLPIPQLVENSPRSMSPHGRTWERVLALTRQPNTAPPKPT